MLGDRGFPLFTYSFYHRLPGVFLYLRTVSTIYRLLLLGARFFQLFTYIPYRWVVRYFTRDLDINTMLTRIVTDDHSYIAEIFELPTKRHCDL